VKRTIVKGADKNCRSKDPSKCRYHGEAFRALTKPSEYVAQMFEQVNKDLSPSVVIPAVTDEDVSSLTDRLFYEMDSLTLEQRGAIHHYSDEYGSMRIRTVLMNPEVSYDFNGDSMELIHSRIQALDSLLKDHTVDVSEVPLWRGVKEFKYELADIQEGSVFQNLSYTPTTTDPEVAVSFSSKDSPILLKVNAKQGYMVGGQFSSEREVLLKRGTTFRVVSIMENAHLEKQNTRFGEDSRVRGITLVELEEV
jgi:hypothetical protein